MKKVTLEYIIKTQQELINEARTLLEPRRDEHAEQWDQKASDLISYSEQHLKMDEIVLEGDRCWRCPFCGTSIRWSYDEIATDGNPVCKDCDEEMELIS